MKQIWPFLSLVLIAAPLAAPAVATADPLAMRAISPEMRAGAGARVELAFAPGKRDRDDRGNSGSNRQRGEDRRSIDRPDNDRQAQRLDRGGSRPAMENRDDRINRAMSVARSRGRVLDAGPQGGSVFWVRVATDSGRVDLLVDADSGRIIGER